METRPAEFRCSCGQKDRRKDMNRLSQFDDGFCRRAANVVCLSVSQFAVGLRLLCCLQRPLLVFFCLPGSCNVGSNDDYLSDSPYGCSGPSFSQSVKQKINDVLPVFVPEPGNAPFYGPHISSNCIQQTFRRRYCVFIYCWTGAATCITDVLSDGRVVLCWHSRTPDINASFLVAVIRIK
jgi:hypothetical protein